MDRLRMLLTLTTASLFALLLLQNSAMAQNDTSSTGEFVVAGDVIQPATYPLTPGQPLSLQQAVRGAGPAADSVMVMIVRPSQAEALWTHALSATSTDPGPQVLSGDVLVVYSTEALKQPVRPNAVLLNQKATVLSLNSTAGTAIRLADVLAVSQLPPETASMFRRSSMRPGRSRLSGLKIDETVEHGDVLKLAAMPAPTQSRRQGFAPQVSEWSASVISTSTTGTPGSATLPTSYTVPEVPVLPDGTSTSEGSTDNIEFEILSGDDNNLEDEEVNVSGTQQSEVFTDTNLAETGRQELQLSRELQDPGNDFERVLADEELAPLPPEEIPVSQVEDAMNVWNLVFVAGLLVAGGLIIAGWIKSEAELKQLEQCQTVPLYSFAETNLPTGSGPTGSGPAEPKPATVSDELFTIRNSLAPLDDTAQEQEPLPTIPSLVPVIADATQTYTVTGGSPAPGVVGATPLVASHEWRSNDWQSTRGSVVPASSSSSNSSSIPGAQRETPSVPVQGIAKEQAPIEPVFNDLNDLIENRLPVELREAQLPLQINLFGKAAGPRRLRVDAAHTQLAGPHMNMSGERRRSEPVNTSASMAATGSQTHAVHQPESDPAQTVRRQRASLDRALNYLHEQGE